MHGDNSEPLYEKVKQDIRSKIINRIYPPDTQIPPEMELMEQYGVSRITVRRAIKELVDEDYLIKRHGVGTFVRPEKSSRRLINISSFADECRQNGHRTKTEIIKKSVVSARRKDERMLGISTSSSLILVERLRYMDDVPVIVERNFFPMSYAWVLDSSEEELNSLGKLLHGKASSSESFADYEIEISYATEEEAKRLQCKPNAPVLLINICTYDASGKPLNRSEQILSGDLFSIHLFAPFPSFEE